MNDRCEIRKVFWKEEAYARLARREKLAGESEAGEPHEGSDMRDLEIPNGMTLGEETQAVFDTCEECGEIIYDGELYQVIGGVSVCERCIDGGWKTAWGGA